MRIDAMITQDQILSCNSFLSFSARPRNPPSSYDHRSTNKRTLGQENLV